MVTDGILEAVNRMINQAGSSEQKEAMEMVWEMLSGFDEDKWYEMGEEEKENWIKKYLPGEDYELDAESVSNKLYLEKIKEYLKKEMIMEFSSPDECMDYFNTYDYQKFKSVDEMKAYQGEYGFGIGEKWYHVNFEEALDIWNKDLKNLYVVKTEDGTWDCHFGKDEGGLVLAQEKGYPVEIYYTRWDANGSSVMERDICNNALELEEALKWYGKCNHVVEEIWDFNLESCKDGRVVQFFADAYSKKMEAISLSFGGEERDSEVSIGAFGEVEKLANDMDQYSYEYDTYEYWDTVSSREEHFEQLCGDIAKGNVQHLVKWLKNIIEEDEVPENVQEAKALLKRLEDVQKSDKKSTLDAKIADAKEHKKGSEKKNNPLDKERDI